MKDGIHIYFAHFEDIYYGKPLAKVVTKKKLNYFSFKFLALLIRC